MVRAQLTHARKSLHRGSIPFVVAVSAIASLRPALAHDLGLTLGLAGRGAEAWPLDSGSLLPPIARLNLGIVSALQVPVSPAADPSGAMTDATSAHVEAPALTVPSLAAFPRRVWQDFGVLIQRPLAFDSRAWTRLALGVGFVGAVACLDGRLRDTVQAHSSAPSRDFANRIRPIATWGGVAAMGLLLGVGELADDATMANTGADGIEASLFASGFITPVIKELAGRQRPNAGQGSGEFEPISRGQSFPSGEATEAFTLAAVVSNHTTSPVLRGLAWGLAGLVGWERAELDAHWASDVVAGALIGVTVGNWVSERSRSEGRIGHSFALRPLIGPRAVGVSGSLSW